MADGELIKRLREGVPAIAVDPSGARTMFDVVGSSQVMRQAADLIEELVRALEELAQPVVCPPRDLDEAFAQREAVRDIARTALSRSMTSDEEGRAMPQAARATAADAAEPVSAPVSGKAGIAIAEDDDPYWDYDDSECWNCGGEGYVYGCSWDWQCDTYDEGEGTCLCARPCHICHPPKSDPTPQPGEAQ